MDLHHPSQLPSLQMLVCSRFLNYKYINNNPYSSCIDAP
jgi:hypothetical protein